MKVIVNYEVTQRIIDLISNGIYKNKEKFEEEMKSIEPLEGIQMMLKFYESSYNYDDYIDIVYRALNELEFNSENGFLTMLYNNSKRLLNIDLLNIKLESIKSYDFGIIEKRLLEKLPKGTVLEPSITFVFDGVNAGSIVGDKTMLMNALFWPSDKKNLPIMESVLLHEYHHIGLKYWMMKMDPLFEKYSDGTSLAKFLLISIMGEGAATYFYTDSDDLSVLLMESHGEETAIEFGNSINNRSDNVDSYILALQNDLKYILTHDLERKELVEVGNKYTYSQGGEPLDKAIGYHMCQTIDKYLGLERLINCFVDPLDFIYVYNEANKTAVDSHFSEEFMTLWSKHIMN